MLMTRQQCKFRDRLCNHNDKKLKTPLQEFVDYVTTASKKKNLEIVNSIGEH